MNRFFLVVIGGTISVVIVAITIWAWGFFGPSGFTDGKSIFAKLQGLEASHRHDTLSTPQVFATYDMVGPVVVVATLDRAFPYAWIAAAIPSCDDELCMVGGSAHLDIKCEDIAPLEVQIRISRSVLEMLQRSCRAG